MACCYFFVESRRYQAIFTIVTIVAIVTDKGTGDETVIFLGQYSCFPIRRYFSTYLVSHVRVFKFVGMAVMFGRNTKKQDAREKLFKTRHR
jgi:hypothetical protein